VLQQCVNDTIMNMPSLSFSYRPRISHIGVHSFEPRYNRYYR